VTQILFMNELSSPPYFLLSIPYFVTNKLHIAKL